RKVVFALLLAIVSTTVLAAEETGYRILVLEPNVPAQFQGGAHWLACGKYFAVTEIGERRIVHLAYTMDVKPNFISLLPKDLTVSLGAQPHTPRLLFVDIGLGRTKLTVEMSEQDYRASLPCTSSGPTT